MKISLAVTTCGETETYKLVDKLVSFILKAETINPHEYSIILLQDSGGTQLDGKAIWKWADSGVTIAWNNHRILDKDFASHKNYLNECCAGSDWILQLDADEDISETLLFNLPALIESNPEAEAYWFPRANTVHGLTHSHVSKWHWVLEKLVIPQLQYAEMLSPSDEEYKLLKDYDCIYHEENGRVDYYMPLIMWPDYQCRLYKNDPSRIRWERPVHEQLVGYTNYTRFPAEYDYAIEHHKEISRQEKQNALYETIQR